MPPNHFQYVKFAVDSKFDLENAISTLHTSENDHFRFPLFIYKNALSICAPVYKSIDKNFIFSWIVLKI